VRYRVRRLTRGGEWSTLGVLFVGVCWGTWAISERGGNLIVPAVTLVLVLLVAAGLFALSRLLGRVILERSMGRVRRTAWPSHLLSAVFLAVAGVQYLRQTQWIVDGITWLRGVS
jgi:Kef-type K+ transport system membrane component KefB